MKFKKKEELVSIIIPYYKKKFFIYECINSVLNQTYNKIEIIIIYDDEDKEDLDFISKIFKSEKKIKLFVNKKNIGAALSRNKGIKVARGGFIAFIDADDIWHKTKLEKQIKFMKRNKYIISHTSYNIIDEKKNFLGARKARTFENCKDLLYSCDIGLSSVMLNKKFFLKNIEFPNLKTKEDFVVWLKILKANIKIGGLNESLVYWRKLNNSLSSNFFQKIHDAFYVYYKYMKFNFFKSWFSVFLLSLNYLKK
jgi:teichuronic acid biosynthesis glycosyltransferase TuaG